MAPNQIAALAELVSGGEVMLLTGAGLSTESGIPDYRGPTGQARNATPMTYQAFIGDPAARRRYWARSHAGWRRWSRFEPNDGHLAVAELQRAGMLSGIVTQNVDGLHTRAGARDVVELHGNLARIVCLDCHSLSSREELHRRLEDANPQWQHVALEQRPDGDVVIDDASVERFVLADCLACGGMLKPDVVYFGERVPLERVQQAYAIAHSSKALLVLGSSLKLMSGHRFVLDADKRGIPVAIVNQGITRGDKYATLKLDAPLGATLTALVAELRGAVAEGG